MYQEFTATTITLDDTQKRLHISFSIDVDEESIQADTVYISDAKGDVIKSRIEKVDGTDVEISIFKPEVNKTYYLYLTRGIHSLTGVPLYNAVKHKFKFHAICKTTLAIVSPNNFEEIEGTLQVTWKDVNVESSEFKFIRVEVATSHLFEKIITDVVQASSENLIKVDAARLAKNQYFLRIRAENSLDDYGAWSEPVAFYYQPKNLPSQNPFGEEIYKKPLEVLTTPEQGETPSSFIFEFDGDLDSKSIDGHVIILGRVI